jgi:polyphosphate kinase 2 (PPK2 family)
VLDTLDMTLRLDEETYGRKRDKYQIRLRDHVHLLFEKQRPPYLCVFEGWDASGKGGAIKRVVQKLDPRGYDVHAFAAPSGEDKEHHYLWRFWRRLPDTGRLAIYDRTWYGRVLVERVEGFAKPEEWKRAYREINIFERMLLDRGFGLAKFWLHVTQDEQLRRFEARKTDPFRSWKLTDEDWRNREQWSAYKEAVDEMLLKTSTPRAPWTVVEANDKYYSRVKVLRTVMKGLEQHVANSNPV